MNSQKTQFTNELDNSIEIEVTDKQLDGHAGVFISLTGPTSSMTNHITRTEAEVLYEQLAQLLGKLK